ncbi:C39 family peptidase [Acutalibacter sp. 1XD8-33]|uniref:C39 family peptidase n=1 Tax=Acutalibacter sp. 1XD8-33 TaxID=2320081 RepID=UPI0013147AA6|nr:C39 family peptidase [Acutalibacter sp. 1XD8-33]
MENMENMKDSQELEELKVLVREEQERKRARREPAHWGVRLLAYMWTAAAVFVAGMVVGGIFGQERQAQDVVPEEMGMEGQAMVDAPWIDQREKYPTGCESITAVMALSYAGVELTVEEFIDGYLPQTSSPWEDGRGGYVCGDPKAVFLGNPYSEDGWGCYSPVIKNALERILAEKKPSLQVEDLGGKSLESLTADYIQEGVPVMLWATMGMEEPRYAATMTIQDTEERFDWISPEHCLLLVGADQDSYFFNDPMAGKSVPYEKPEVELAYEALGSQALAIVGGRRS